VRFLARRFTAASVKPHKACATPASMAGAKPLPPSLPPPWRPRQAPQRRPAGTLPAGSTPAFERIAKLIFIRMQAANDKADLDDLRQFATPEMFAAFKLDLQDRKDAQQQTDVVQLAAEVIDFEQEAARQVVSVRFHGLIREEKGAPAAPFDEIWHLVKPLDGSREWAIAGIAQAS
jgi:predicted lipid-binding transport protein (Tim44 family)